MTPQEVIDNNVMPVIKEDAGVTTAATGVNEVSAEQVDGMPSTIQVQYADVTGKSITATYRVQQVIVVGVE